MRAGSVGSVKALLGAGADVNQTDKAGRTALDWIPAVAVFAIGIGAWQGLVAAFHVQEFLLPKPTAIGDAFWTQKSALWSQGIYTFKEALGKVGQLRTVPPKKVKGKSAPCQQVVLKGPDVNLDLLPGIQAWPDDGGVFLNLGLTHTKHPETGARNLGMYRLQKQDSRTVSLHWQIHKDSNSHHAVAERRGERLPVAIAFGCPPAVTYAATAPLPAVGVVATGGE